MKYSVQQIATLLGGSIEGNGNAEIHDIAPIENASSGDLAFLANPKYTPHIYETGATAVLVSNDFVGTKTLQTTLIRVKDPYLAFTFLLEQIRNLFLDKKGIEQPSFIEESAEIGENVYVGAFSYIGKGAKIGNNVKVFPQCYIGDNAQIGDDCTLYPGVKIYDNVKFGRKCIVHSGAIIGSDGFGFAPLENGVYRKIPQTGTVVCEDEVEIGANVTIDRATLGLTILRKGVKIDNLVQIAHNVEIGAHTVVAAQSGISGSSKLGEKCMVGGQVGIVGHIFLPNETKIGAQSGVSKSYEKEGIILRGSPAQEYRKQLRVEAQVRLLDEMNKKISALEEKIAFLEQKV